VAEIYTVAYKSTMFSKFSVHVAVAGLVGDRFRLAASAPAAPLNSVLHIPIHDLLQMT
jgi:hypothetical protein